MLIYIHVPFCRRKCQYCAFHSEPLQADKAQAYVNGLLREIALWGDRLGKVPVETVFFGGGTPSMLPARTIVAILDKLRSAFSLSPAAEISMEANPDSVASMDTLQTLLEGGVNRLSLGVQSLDTEALYALGRPHSARDAVKTFELARTTGFSNINIDLIWGLPGQRLKLWLDELKRAVGLGPDHLSCYGLTIEEGTPLEAAYLKGHVELPDEDEQAKMFVYGADYLESQGYIQYEISNFSRMGFQCRHNIGYWEGQEYLGLGPAAVSTVQGRRWSNTENLTDYAQQTQNGSIARDAMQLTPFERVQELVMLRLRTARGLRVKAYRELTGRDFVKDHRELIHALHKNGLVRLRNGYLNLTRNGMLVSNSILENLFTAMETSLNPSLEQAAGKQPDGSNALPDGRSGTIPDTPSGSTSGEPAGPDVYHQAEKA